MKTILRWPGSKWRIADWIARQFPTHETYVEPFFGSGAVFFTKRPSGTETINDIDNEVVNLFRIVRDHAEKLCKAIEMTPYSRQEYISSMDEKAADSLERARRFLVRTWQGYGGKTNCTTGWAHDRSNSVFRPKYWSLLPTRILNIVERLKMVQIENMDALELIALYNRKSTLLYVDPPYLLETRTSKHYKHEFTTRKKHMELLEVCMKHKGFCLISSYDNELYNTILKDWTKRTIKVQTNNAKTAIECLYVNPAADMEMKLF